MKAHLKEVEARLSGHVRKKSAFRPESYIGGGQSKLRYLGLRVPQIRDTLKAGFSFSSRDPDQVSGVWDYIWHHTDCFEVMALGLAWFEDRKRIDQLPRWWPLLKKWSARIDNWAHSDSLSGIYARILEHDPALVYPTLKKWNRSENPWLRRLSIVSLLYYSSQRKKVLPLGKILPLVEAQLDFDHYYVQKGVGWVLREAGNVYPEKTHSFVERNILRISSAAYHATTEKMSRLQKEKLNQSRKKGRIRNGSH